MHRHEELIAALADGSLDPQRRAEAEAMVGSDPDLAALLRAHREALRAVADAAPALMTPVERARVRSGVADALGVEAEVPTAAIPGRRLRWTSVATAAVAVAAFLAFIPLAGMLTPGGAGFKVDLDQAALRLAEGSDPIEATAAEDLDPILSVGADDVADAAADQSSDPQAPGGTVVIEPPLTEDEATTTTIATATTSASPTVSDVIGALEKEVGGLTEFYASAEAVDDETACAPEARVALSEGDAIFGAGGVHAFPVTRGDGSTVVVFFRVGSEGEVETLAVLDTDQCELLASFR
jgi:hypothetical protein